MFFFSWDEIAIEPSVKLKSLPAGSGLLDGIGASSGSTYILTIDPENGAGGGPAVP
jgi:hypothetical protein